MWRKEVLAVDYKFFERYFEIAVEQNKRDPVSSIELLLSNNLDKPHGFNQPNSPRLVFQKLPISEPQVF